LIWTIRFAPRGIGSRIGGTDLEFVGANKPVEKESGFLRCITPVYSPLRCTEETTMRILALLLLAGPAWGQIPSAQQKVVPPPGTIFQRLGITPTGLNG